jgi:LacI family transcriptional regulator
MATPQVALLIETSNAYARGLLRGIRNYVLERGPWSIYLGEQRRGESAPQWLQNWQGDGIIARIETQPIARVMKSLTIPVVDVSAARLIRAFPYVETEDAKIAQVAADHLRECGFRTLAFCGDARYRWSRNRELAFRAIAEKWRIPCHVYPHYVPQRKANNWEQEHLHLVKWVQSLPRPIGIMAAYDIRGRQILDICRDLYLHVPDEIAVIGVDNDELLCEFASPSLSSVRPDTIQTGYEAAALLDRMMQGQIPEKTAHLIDPLGVATRGSTDVLAIQDPDVIAAVRYIRHHATEELSVEDILKVVPLSRRILESRFKKLIGRTPHEEIERIRINMVKQLLVETDLTLAQIAVRVGFKHVEYMCVSFKRVTEHSPGQYRQLHRN